VHTCDRRHSKSWIAERYPGVVFEEGFGEEDELWDPVLRESEGEEDARSRRVLGEVFANDEGTYISVTAHSGTVASLLRGE
jgi:hypothetical protein